MNNADGFGGQLVSEGLASSVNGRVITCRHHQSEQSDKSLNAPLWFPSKGVSWHPITLPSSAHRLQIHMFHSSVIPSTCASISIPIATSQQWPVVLTHNNNPEDGYPLSWLVQILMQHLVFHKKSQKKDQKIEWWVEQSNGEKYKGE